MNIINILYNDETPANNVGVSFYVRVTKCNLKIYRKTIITVLQNVT
jgi:hypothetical protein